MKRNILLSTTALVASTLILSFYHRDPKDVKVPPPQAIHKPDSSRSKIQIVFALDATGSMSGLIGAAKEKIWSIAGSLAQADPAPVIEMGLIFYRDRGDQFVTRRIALTSDIDQAYEKLMQISAEGGGDMPESVNQALHEAITKFAWDTAASTYKTVFLVGDCPPHMDYANDIKYPASCESARQKDIVLNTILMGNDLQAKKIWREISQCSQGSYTQVNMDANDIEVNTPYDSAIAALSDQLDDTRIYYGNAEDKAASVAKVSKSKYITGYSKPNVKAQRAEYNSSKAGKDSYYGNKELLESYKSNSISLESIKQEELPEEMKKMNAPERKKFVEEKIARRDSLNKELMKFTKLRQAFIEKDLKARKSGEVDSSFSNQIYKSIQKQTEKKGIYLREKAKY